ncbi:class I SAM-dependent methyltransferase [uncultured Winogradskyella sp.]|uniref:class I SAM-dependent methyltransferase n=1 Tax=uncultured Winogradskyella sp. TaxID=395353 RepID=UPI002615A7D8|nr:class I SAM-dependent methyltransferase [uncultured Winogradskyella sp.]
MNRVELIQSIINKKKITRYLEIGTYKGQSFFPIKCKRKVAVDPQFNIPLKRKLKWIYKDFNNLFNTYAELTSDDFFEKKASLVQRFKPQLVFVDGLHTFKASLLDVLNSLKYLSNDGVIIMHDCLPPNKAASIFANSFKEAIAMKLEGWTGEWTGDVWKTIVYLKEKYGNALKVCVFDSDYGLGYIRVVGNVDDFSIDEAIFNKVDAMSYDTLMADTSLINLKPVDQIYNTIES